VRLLEFSGTKLKKARVASNLKQADLAAILSVGYRTLQSFEAGTAVPNANTLALAALILEVSVLDLYDIPPV